jgi:hypothetical protein
MDSRQATVPTFGLLCRPSGNLRVGPTPPDDLLLDFGLAQR